MGWGPVGFFLFETGDFLSCVGRKPYIFINFPHKKQSKIFINFSHKKRIC